MNKRNIIVIICVLALLALGGAVWHGKKAQEVQENSALITASDRHDQRQNEVSKELSDREKIDRYIQNWNGDTNNWKTYRNEEFGVEFKYPEEVLYVQDIKDGGDVDQIRLTQNGREGENIDEPGNMILSLNDFQSEKGYVLETEGECQQISIFNGKGNICSEKGHIEQDRETYSSFLERGVCSGSVLINFDLPHYPATYTNFVGSDGRNRLYISCDSSQSSQIMRIFRGIFQSIHFSFL